MLQHHQHLVVDSIMLAPLPLLVFLPTRRHPHHFLVLDYLRLGVGALRLLELQVGTLAQHSEALRPVPLVEVLVEITAILTIAHLVVQPPGAGNHPANTLLEVSVNLETPASFHTKRVAPVVAKDLATRDAMIGVEEMLVKEAAPLEALPLEALAAIVGEMVLVEGEEVEEVPFLPLALDPTLLLVLGHPADDRLNVLSNYSFLRLEKDS